MRKALPAAVLFFSAALASAETNPAEETAPCAGDAQPSPTAEPPLEPKGFVDTVTRSVVDEAKRYLTDAGALLTSPLRWDASDAKKAAAFGATLGVLLLADEDIAHATERTRSRFTDDVSRATTRFGASYAWAISGALFAGGIIVGKPGMRDTGREAIEAAVFAGLLTDAFKSAFGRERPNASNDETVFRPFSSNQSFPSGHATVAFSVASVIAMRSDGWIIPSLAYATAFTVAMDRINDRAHFASDVFTAAVIGVTTGRFIVQRHRRAAVEAPRVDLELLPIQDGVAARLRF